MSARPRVASEDLERLDRVGRALAAKAMGDPARRDELIDLATRIDDVINDLQEWADV